MEYGEDIRKLGAQYIDVVDKMDALARELKHLKMARKDLEDRFLDLMKQGNITTIKLADGGGSISRKSKKSKSGLSEGRVCDIIAKSLQNESSALALIQDIKKTIKINEKDCIDYKKE